MTDTKHANDPFLDGNEIVEKAIGAWHEEDTKENLFAVLEAICTRMYQEGEFVVPVIPSEDGSRFSFRALQTKDGRNWLAAFTSHQEQEKGPASQAVSYFIDAILKACLNGEKIGLILNPFGLPFMLTPDMIEMIFKADGGTEYLVPDDAVTPELAEDGSFLKRAVGICKRNPTQRNLMRLARILRGSMVWIPCSAVFSDADKEAMDKAVNEAIEKDDLDSLVGQTFVSHDFVRLVPDILQSGEDFFFPVFTAEEEMGEYGQGFSKVQNPFTQAVNLARNNENNVAGIVINAFTDPFFLPRELFDVIEGQPSDPEEAEDTEE